VLVDHTALRTRTTFDFSPFSVHVCGLWSLSRRCVTFEQLYAALVPERVRPQEAASLQRSALLLLHTHSAFVAFSAHSAHSCYKFKMCGLTREDQANLARVYSSVDMGRFEPLYTDTARVLETHFARLAQRPHREDSACSSIKQQCAPLLTFPLFSVHARALASMRDVIAPLIAALVLETHLRV
jgi:hypothetical protein